MFREKRAEHESQSKPNENGAKVAESKAPPGSFDQIIN
jgi:hypothetical protein